MRESCSFAGVKPNKQHYGKGNLFNGLTTDQLSEMIRESVRDGLQQMPPPRPKTESKLLTRRETARRLRISLVTLTDWVNRGKICAHKIGGRVLFRESDVEASLNRIIPIKNR